MSDYNSDGSVTSDYLGRRKTYGTGNALTSEQVAQILYQVGFRGEDLAYFVGIAVRESGNQPAIHGTDQDPSRNSGDLGLFGINSVNDTPAARAAVGYTDRSQWYDPVIAAKMVWYLSQGGKNKNPWRGGPGGYSSTGDPYAGVDMHHAIREVDAAAQHGLLGTDYASGGSQGGGGYGGAGGQTFNGQASSAVAGPFTLPSDAKLYNNGIGVFAVFDVGGVKVSYGVNWWDGSVKFDQSQVQHVNVDQWNQLGTVDGGNAEELRTLGGQYGSYGEFFRHVLAQVMGSNNPASSDPQVLKVLAEFAGRPDMTAAELQNKLQATPWYQQHTTSQLEWNGLSDAEKSKRRDSTAAQMADVWWQFGGQQVGAADPRIANYLEDVASGKMGIGAWTELVKKQALTDGESPWSRQVRNEDEERRQRGVDIENTSQKVKDLARRWGVPLSDRSAWDWANKIKSNNASEADVLEELKKQAQVLYPWKAPDVETVTAAAPWMETYSRVMENQADLFTPKVQAALTKGAPVWQFEQELKRSDEWLGTKNARESITQTVADMGHRMGFN